MHSNLSHHLTEMDARRAYDRSSFVVAVSSAYARISELRARLDDALERLDDVRMREAEVVERRAELGARLLAAERRTRAEQAEADAALAEVLAVAEREAARILDSARAEVEATRVAAAELAGAGRTADVVDLRGHTDAATEDSGSSADEVIAI